MESINIRRSIRKYKSTKVEKEKIEKLLKSAMQAPSAGNQQPWEFLVIENEDTLKELAGMSLYAKMVEKAPLAIVLLGNQDYMRFPENWEQDMAAAMQNLILEAVELDLGSVWLGVAPLEERMIYIKELFKLEDEILPFSIAVLGYPEGEGNKFIERYDETRVHYEKY